MSSGIEARIDRLRASATIPLDSVDFTVNDPEQLRSELGETFSYFGRVESEVAADPLLVMMPRLGTEYRGYKSHGREFLDVWVDQEQAHGVIFDELQRQLGLEPLVPNAEVTRLNRIGGALGKLSTSLHAVLEMVYLSRGAMHEKLTFVGYARMAQKLDFLGERALLDTVIKPIRKQEAGHLSYYKYAAREIKSHLNLWQLALARQISILTYAPVGARTPQEKLHFGQVALALAGEHVEEFSDPIQAIAEHLLTVQDTQLPAFVAKALRDCVDAQKQLSNK